MADNKKENKKGKLISVNPLIENGQHAKWKEAFKFIAVMDNGDVGTLFCDTAVCPHEINKEYEYTKTTGSSNQGPWTIIGFRKDKNDSNGRDGGREDFRASKQERTAKMKVDCLIALSNIFQGAGALGNDFKAAVPEMFALAGIDQITDGSPNATKPAKKPLDDTAKENMKQYLRSNDVSKIVSVVVGLNDYEVDNATLVEIFSVMIKAF